MKMILNKCYGGFSLSQACADKLGLDIFPWKKEVRFNPQLIAEVERDSDWASGNVASLQVVNIPDDATDFHIDTHDGIESVVFVVDGKLHWA